MNNIIPIKAITEYIIFFFFVYSSFLESLLANNNGMAMKTTAIILKIRNI